VKSEESRKKVRREYAKYAKRDKISTGVGWSANTPDSSILVASGQDLCAASYLFGTIFNTTAVGPVTSISRLSFVQLKAWSPGFASSESGVV
jgi:hypothetical protein